MDLKGIGLCDQDTAGKLAAIALLHFRTKGQTIFRDGSSRPLKTGRKARGKDADGAGLQAVAPDTSRSAATAENARRS